MLAPDRPRNTSLSFVCASVEAAKPAALGSGAPVSRSVMQGEPSVLSLKSLSPLPSQSLKMLLQQLWSLTRRVKSIKCRISEAACLHAQLLPTDKRGFMSSSPSVENREVRDFLRPFSAKLNLSPSLSSWAWVPDCKSKEPRFQTTECQYIVTINLLFDLCLPKIGSTQCF